MSLSMKRSEVIRRAKGIGGPLLIDEDYTTRLATALGIEVEPDEPALPERLELDAGIKGTSAEWHSWGHYYGGPQSRSYHIEVHGLEHKALLDALISAYNSRPQWRTVVPPGPAGQEYLVRLRSSPNSPVAKGFRDGGGHWWLYDLDGVQRGGYSVDAWLPFQSLSRDGSK